MKLFRILCVMSLAMLVLISSGCANTQQTAAPTAETVPAEAEEPVSVPEEETVTSEQPEEPAAVESPAGASDVPEGAASEETAPAAETETAAEPKSAGRDKLVIFFSRTGEQYTVGVIDKGNTAIVAEMIAEIADADLFEVLPVDDHYPMTYNALTDIAKQEQNAKARPEYAGTLPDLAQYDTIFIGAPVWWGDWPMIMYTLFENNDFSGKKLVPFSTHEGSGLSGFDRKLASACPNSEILTGLAIRGNDCQNKQDAVRQSVESWLNSLGY